MTFENDKPIIKICCIEPNFIIAMRQNFAALQHPIKRFNACKKTKHHISFHVSNYFKCVLIFFIIMHFSCGIDTDWYLYVCIIKGFTVSLFCYNTTYLEYFSAFITRPFINKIIVCCSISFGV